MNVSYTERLVGGKEVKVSPEDLVSLLMHSWYISSSGYVMAKFRFGGARKDIGLHRYITKAPEGLAVDHLNGDRLDNRRENLRVCTNSENEQSKPKQSYSCSSKYKGVTWDKAVNKWKASIKLPGNKSQKHLGHFMLEDSAARAYDSMAKKYFTVPNLNFPHEH